MPETVEETVEILPELIDALTHTAREIKRLTEAENALKTAIKAALGEKELATVNGTPVVRWAHVKSRRLDMNELRAQVDPAVLAGCYVEEINRRFITLVRLDK